jgi:hypothetical protein
MMMIVVVTTHVNVMVVSTILLYVIVCEWGQAVAQLVEALRYKSEGCGFDSRWCHWNFSLP